MDIFPSPESVMIEKLKKADLESTSPLEALNLLANLKKDIDKKGL